MGEGDGVDPEEVVSITAGFGSWPSDDYRMARTPVLAQSWFQAIRGFLTERPPKRLKSRSADQSSFTP